MVPLSMQMLRMLFLSLELAFPPLADYVNSIAMYLHSCIASVVDASAWVSWECGTDLRTMVGLDAQLAWAHGI